LYPKAKTLLELITERNPAALGTAGLVGAAALQSEDADATFLGLRSLKGLANQDMLGMAKKMQATGMNAEDIWGRTGWNQGADGMWRTEHTNYDNTKINLEGLEGSGSNVLTLGDVIDDPVLLNSYDGENPLLLGEVQNEGYGLELPKLRDYKIQFDPKLMTSSIDGSFDPKNHAITLSPDLTYKKLRETILHEMQHAVQQQEGFSDGLSTDAIKYAMDNYFDDSQSFRYLQSLFGTKLPREITDDDVYNAYKNNAGEVEAEVVVGRDKLASMKPYNPRAVPPERFERADGALPREQQNLLQLTDFDESEQEIYGEYGGRFKRNEKNLATGIGLLGAAADASSDEGEQDSGESELDRIMRLTDEIERKDEMAKAFGSTSLGDVALDLVGMGVESAAKEIAGLSGQALRSLYLGITGRPKDDQSVYSTVTSPDFMPESYSPEAQAIVDNYINPAMEKAGNVIVENVIYPAAGTDLGQAAIRKGADAVQAYQGMSPRAQNFIDAGGAGLLALLSVGTGGRAKPTSLVPDKELIKLIGR